MKIEIDAYEYILGHFSDSDINTLILKLFRERDESQLYLLKKMHEIAYESDKEAFIQYIKEKSKDNCRLSKYFKYE